MPGGRGSATAAVVPAAVVTAPGVVASTGADTAAAATASGTTTPVSRPYRRDLRDGGLPSGLMGDSLVECESAGLDRRDAYPSAPGVSAGVIPVAQNIPVRPTGVHPVPVPKSTGGGGRERIPAAPARGEDGAAQWVPKECTVVER